MTAKILNLTKKLEEKEMQGWEVVFEPDFDQKPDWDRIEVLIQRLDKLEALLKND